MPRSGTLPSTPWRILLLAATVGSLAAEEAREPLEGRKPEATPLHIVVMDPLSDKLSCDCVAGYARRKYGALCQYLERKTGRPVEISYAETLSSPKAHLARGVDLVAGKYSEVRFDARKIGLSVRPIAMTSEKDGSIVQRGLFVVRAADPARSVEHLRGRRLLFGPAESIEKHAAAMCVLEAFGLPVLPPIRVSPSCSAAALAVVEKDADCAVISSYAMPLLEGCGTIDKGSLRILAETDAVPFITVFATERVDARAAREIRQVLSDVSKDPFLLEAMESRDGFVPVTKLPEGDLACRHAWPDWRGPNRDGRSDDVPASLPAAPRLLWSRTLTGPAMSGLSVAAGRVMAADKDIDENRDVFRCLDADTGEECWKIEYPAEGEMDFTNSPRATPVIHDGRVYTLGAFGDLVCAKLENGQVLWRTNIIEQFQADRPAWGTSATPLVVGDVVIVNPGAADAALAALDRRTGAVVWKSPGSPAAYASYIELTLGERRQLVGYDAISLGGWDLKTGRRLWSIVPEEEGDYNVPTPIALDDGFLVSTENNGTRRYRIEPSGRAEPRRVASNADLAPDTATPVVVDGLVVAGAGRLLCLDLEDGLKTVWESDDERFFDFTTIIAGNGRALVTTKEGSVHLIEVSRSGYRILGSLDLFEDVPSAERQVWSHPALVDNRLYVRNLLGVYCFLLD